jgi:Meiotically up-regulated gene 113
MRERIISEIKRVAAENSGEPPGEMPFLRETGIKRSAWLGRYWARWGDAMREAGFEPNQLQTKTTDDFMFSKLADAFRHYRKVPTSAELRMYRNLDPTFPVHSTIDKHFPTKAEMISRLRVWAVKMDAYGDITAMLPAPEAVPQCRTPRAAAQDGFVYLLRSGAHYKIGKSDQIERRIKEIRVALPEAATLEHTILTDDPSGIEAYWHKRFADYRVNGEWFKLSPSDVLAFKRRKFQ